MFYDNLIKLCVSNNTTPTAVAVAIGLNKSAATAWKRGTKPTDITLSKIAEYFGVTVDYLKSTEEKKPAPDTEDELTEYLEMLRNRPECKVLLDTARGATKAQVEENVRFLEALRKAKNAD